MENTILWTKEYKNTMVKSLTVEDESVTITFENNEKITFSTYHDQDCCESVYGDFSIVKYHEKEFFNNNLTKIEVKSVEGMGFLLCFDFYYDKPTKIFVPCYDYQNGYYSDNLDLLIKEGEVKTTIDISSLVEHHID